MSARPVRPLRVAVVGGGWAGLAAAVKATLDGHQVSVFEASRHWGGRARTVRLDTPHGPLDLDNGQHILIGAYTRTLSLMEQVGIDPQQVLMRLPLTLVNPQGTGLRLPHLPAPWNATAGILSHPTWHAKEKVALLWRATCWAARRFRCSPHTTVADLCSGLPLPLINDFLAPLCVSALNTPLEKASGQAFLTVLKDALFSGSAGSNLLIPRVPLGALWPEPAVAWLTQHGASCQLGQRIVGLHRQGTTWNLMEQAFDGLIWANQHRKVLSSLLDNEVNAIQFGKNEPLSYTAIATVYAQVSGANTTWRLTEPMLALQDGPDQPAQFVFDRGQLGNPPGLLAFVVSAATGTAAEIEHRVLQQGKKQLDLELSPIKTVMEKHATFACTPNVLRPRALACSNLWLAGDEVDGPYPATLEGAMRSGWNAAEGLSHQLLQRL